MRTITFILLMSCPLLLFGQTSPADTAKIGANTRAVASLGQSLTTLGRSVSALTSRTDTLTKRIDKAINPADCTFCQAKLDAGQHFLVYMPLILFMLASFYVLTRLRQEGYKLSDALKENYTVELNQDSPEGAAAKAQALTTLKNNNMLPDAVPALADADVPVQIRPQSTSRLIAFFAGMAAVIVSVSAVSFFFYVYLRTGKEPQFESLWNVVLGLGVGVVPYAFARISDALNPKPNQ